MVGVRKRTQVQDYGQLAKLDLLGLPKYTLRSYREAKFRELAQTPKPASKECKRKSRRHFGSQLHHDHLRAESADAEPREVSAGSDSGHRTPKTGQSPKTLNPKKP